MKLDIKKTIYNKTYSKDGIHQEVDTTRDYVAFIVSFQKRYVDCENKNELIDKIKIDLNEMLLNLDKMRGDDNDREL